MSHALDWIAQHGRYRRSISAAALRRELGREPRRCTWCGQEVPRGRTTWCGPECVREFRERCDPNYIRGLIRRTKPLRCEVCGLDIEAIVDLHARVRRAWEIKYYEPSVCRVYHAGHYNRRGRRNQRRMDRFAKLHGVIPQCSAFARWIASRGLTGYWEADHVLPVCEGGGLCGPEGYRVLCIPCHRAATAELAARRRRRE